MTDSSKIPGFRVRIVQVDGKGEHDVHTTDFKQPPGSDFLDHRYGAQTWDNIRIRRKTFEGDMFITFREQSAGQTQGLHSVASPKKPAELKTHAGQLFRVVVEQLPEEQWLTGSSIKFKPPKATIAAEAGGWRVTFEPQQYPCVLTVAVADQGTKDENLPSFPFPTNPKFTRGSFFIPQGQFGAKEGGILRLGVRGAGMSTQLKLPAAGKTLEVEPTAFKVAGPAQPDLMTDAYVAQKYAEKASLIQYA